MSKDEGRPEQIEFPLEEGRQEFARRKNRASSLQATTRTKTAPLDSQLSGAMFDSAISIRHLAARLKNRTRNAFQRGSTVAMYGPILALAVLIYFLIFS
jgi:hypothetical protein|tara:strand:- start:59 stop:355 length:297 start_codon:yes stop_codon:yes gene_type:complete